MYYGADINQSERSHNQGNKEQVITPEMELSMQLRRDCKELLRKKGKTVFSTSELIIQFLQPLGAIRSLAKWTKPQNLVRRREVYLGKEGDSQPNIFISCVAVDPSKAYLEILNLDMSDTLTQLPSEVRLTGLRWLRLERKERGVIMTRNNVDSKTAGIGEFMKPLRLATIEDLSYYKKLINESMPIEHK